MEKKLKVLIADNSSQFAKNSKYSGQLSEKADYFCFIVSQQ